MKIYVDYEEFKKITYPGIREDFYLISNFGTVWHIKDNRPISFFIDKDGYSKCALQADRVGNKSIFKKYFVHRLVAWEFCTANRDLDLVINHIDACKQNNYYENLEWCTIKHNNEQGFITGNSKKGIRHHKNVYPEKLIHAICLLMQDGLSNGQVRREVKPYGFNSRKMKDLIRHIRNRDIWKDINNLYVY